LALWAAQDAIRRLAAEPDIQHHQKRVPGRATDLQHIPPRQERDKPKVQEVTTDGDQHWARRNRDSLTLVKHTAEGTLRLLLKHPEVIHTIFLRVWGFRRRADNVSESRERRCWIFLAHEPIETVPAKEGFKVIPEI
jgi:hypothetical protein